MKINHVVWKEFKKTGKVEIIYAEPFIPDVRNYFRQQEFIKGTNIRKDKFREMFNKNTPLVLDLDSLPEIDTKDWISKFKKYMKKTCFLIIESTGVPQKYLGNGR